MVLFASANFTTIISQIQALNPTLSVCTFTDTTATWALIEGNISTTTPLPGIPTSNPRMIVRLELGGSDITFKFDVNFTTLQSGLVTEAAFQELLQTLQPNSGYCLCPGLPQSTTERLTFKVRWARKWGFPFARVDHQKCKMWFPVKNIPQNLTRTPTCDQCSTLLYYVTKT